MPPIVVGGIFLGALLLLATALGRRLMRWLGVAGADPLEHGVVAAGLGLGTLQFLPFTLFATAIGWPVTIRIAVALLATLLIPDAAAVLKAVWRQRRALWGIAWWQYSVLGVFLILLSTVFVRSVCPVSDPDGLIYHVTAALRYLRAGRFHYLPTLTYTNWPLGIEMLFALALAIDTAIPVSIIQFAAGSLTLALVYCYARRLGGAFAGAVAPCLLLLVPIFWHEMAYAYIDLGTSLFATLAVASFTRAAEARGWFILSAFFAGLTATTKMSCVPVVVILPILIVLNGRASRASLRAAARHGLIAIAVVLPWVVRTWLLTGNPVYPLFYQVLGGYEWTADGWERLHRGHLLYNAPPMEAPPSTALLHATHAVIVVGLIAVALAVVRATRGTTIAVPARFAALFAAAVSCAGYFHTRFLLGAFPCVAVCGAVWFHGRERRLAPIVCCAAVALAANLGWRSMRPDLNTAVAVACGQCAGETYLGQRLAELPVVHFTNERLPDNARILVCMREARLAHYERQALNANYWLQDSIHYESDDGLEEDLRRLKVTHLILTPVFPAWFDRSHHSRPRKQIEAARLLQFAIDHGEQLFERNGVVLYKLRLPCSENAMDAHAAR